MILKYRIVCRGLVGKSYIGYVQAGQLWSDNPAANVDIVRAHIKNLKTYLSDEFWKKCPSNDKQSLRHEKYRFLTVCNATGIPEGCLNDDNYELLEPRRKVADVPVFSSGINVYIKRPTTPVISYALERFGRLDRHIVDDINKQIEIHEGLK